MLTNKLTGAGAADKTYIEDVFSTYLYTGNGSTQTINNGIQLGPFYGAGPTDGATFNGSTSLISIANNSNLNLNSVDYTIELWVYPTSTNSYQTILGKHTNFTSEPAAGYSLWIEGGKFTFGINGNYNSITSSTNISLNTWSYVAICGNGSSTKLFVNGVQVGSIASGNTTATSLPFVIGRNINGVTWNASYPFTGSLSNLRIIKGTQLYSSNFTPPTPPLTAISNTQLLCLQGSTPFVDNSPNSFTLSTTDVSSGLTITQGEGGMVWLKSRSATTNHFLFDTSRGALNELNSNTAEGQTSLANSLTAFNSNGFSLGSAAGINVNTATYTSWTFRKAPKFFDVVPVVNGTNTYSHSLGVAPGMIMVKCTDASGAWWVVYHRSLTNPNNYYLALNNTNAEANAGTAVWGATATTFTVDQNLWSNGQTGIAYLFAHDTTTDGLIQCGSYTGNGSTNGPVINLGWEPQYLMIKKSSSTGNWQILDNMRGMPVGSAEATLQANLSYAESSVEYVSPTADGFQITSTNTEVNSSGSTYIYMAIRRGPMRTPTDATKVFAPDNAGISSGSAVGTPIWISGFPVDFYIQKGRVTGSTGFTGTRLLGPTYLQTTSTAVEASDIYAPTFDSHQGPAIAQSSYTYSDRCAWMFKRAPGFFDVVCYTGNGQLSASQVINHQLKVVPELVITKARSDGSKHWTTYCNGKILRLNGGDAGIALNGYIKDLTSTTFTAENYSSPTYGTNYYGVTYVAYLFASCPGVSKVFSVTKTSGSNANVDCGFSAGARFVMLKRTDSTGDWYVWDTARGIVSANDPYLLLNSTAAENTSTDYIDPLAAGFTIVDGGLANGSYIGLAIA